MVTRSRRSFVCNDDVGLRISASTRCFLEDFSQHPYVSFWLSFMLRLSPADSIFSGELSFRDCVSRRRISVKAAFDDFFQELIFAFRGYVFIYNLPKAQFIYSRAGAAFKSLSDIRVDAGRTKGERFLNITFSFVLYRGEKSRFYAVKGRLIAYKSPAKDSKPLRFECL